MSTAAKRVVVVGAGISGLVTAYRLLQTSNGTPIDITVVEASRAPGGKVRTGQLGGVPIEEGADSFVVRKPWAIDLCRELGLGDDLVAPVAGGAYVWARGGLKPFPARAAFGIPGSVEEMLRWPGLSARGRVRALGDLLRPRRRGGDDESLRSLAVRRLGPEAADVLVGPLLSGIHAGDPERLGVAATFPELRRWELEHGSLIRGARAAWTAARSASEPVPLFATVWSGLATVTATLSSALGVGRLRTGELVSSVEREGDGWVVRITGGGGPIAADAVVLAVPAFESARILEGSAPDAARDLAAIRYASTAVISLIYPTGTAGRLPPGTGVIVPPARPHAQRGAPRAIAACTWISSKWPRDEHAGRAVIRCFVGRDGADDVTRLEDDELVRLAVADVEAITPLGAEPEADRVSRWPRSMPQYDVGHLERLSRIEAALAGLPGLFLTGSAYRGVGIADCVRQANDAAEVVRQYLAPHARATEGKGSSERSGTAIGPDVEREAIT